MKWPRRAKFVGHLQAVRLRPGDVLVLRSQSRISGEVAALLLEELRAAFPDHKAFIIENADLGVIHRG